MDSGGTRSCGPGGKKENGARPQIQEHADERRRNGGMEGQRGRGGVGRIDGGPLTTAKTDAQLGG